MCQVRQKGNTMTDQSEINAEMAAISAEARAATEAGARPGLHPRRDYTPYRSSTLRQPTHALVKADPEEIGRPSPAFGQADVDDYEAALTIQHRGEPLGE